MQSKSRAPAIHIQDDGQTCTPLSVSQSFNQSINQSKTKLVPGPHRDGLAGQYKRQQHTAKNRKIEAVLQLIHFKTAPPSLHVRKIE